nr:PRD domain-containing protein [Bibersteinia trehalosi]
MYSSHDDFLYTQTQIAYPEAFRCVEKIARYLQNQFNKALNHDEQLYLIIHIQRVIGDKR